MNKFIITLLTAISSFSPVYAENYLESRGKYLVCPNNNRVVDPLNLPLKASAPFRLKKRAKRPNIKIPENPNPYRLNFCVNLLRLQMNEAVYCLVEYPNLLLTI